MLISFYSLFLFSKFRKYLFDLSSLLNHRVLAFIDRLLPCLWSIMSLSCLLFSSSLVIICRLLSSVYLFSSSLFWFIWSLRSLSSLFSIFHGLMLISIALVRIVILVNSSFIWGFMWAACIICSSTYCFSSLSRSLLVTNVLSSLMCLFFVIFLTLCWSVRMTAACSLLVSVQFDSSF